MSEKTMLLEDILLKAMSLNCDPICIQQSTWLSQKASASGTAIKKFRILEVQEVTF